MQTGSWQSQCSPPGRADLRGHQSGGGAQGVQAVRARHPSPIALGQKSPVDLVPQFWRSSALIHELFLMETHIQALQWPWERCAPPSGAAFLGTILSLSTPQPGKCVSDSA
jgi:hypothetical protein